MQGSLAAEWERAQAAEDAFNEERAGRYRAVLAAQQEGALDVDVEELMVGDSPPSPHPSNRLSVAVAKYVSIFATLKRCHILRHQLPHVVHHAFIHTESEFLMHFGVMLSSAARLHTLSAILPGFWGQYEVYCVEADLYGRPEPRCE